MGYRDKHSTKQGIIIRVIIFAQRGGDNLNKRKCKELKRKREIKKKNNMRTNNRTKQKFIKESAALQYDV